MNLGEKLYELRKEKNLSQEDVADRLNVTRQTISKWETNQSTPDFDKIIPLCELFEITSEELLIGNKTVKDEFTSKNDEYVADKKKPTREEVKKKSAEVVGTAIFMYIVAVALLIIAIPVLRINPIVATSIFLILIAWPTVRIVKHYMTIPKFEDTKQEKREKEIEKQINGIIGGICTAIYFIVSFMTMAWHITWVIFIINGLICQIVKLIMLLMEGKKDEE